MSQALDPRLQALAERGVTPAMARAAADEARQVKGDGVRIAPAYVFAILERWLAEPARVPAAAQDPKAAALEAIRILEERDDATRRSAAAV